MGDIYPAIKDMMIIHNMSYDLRDSPNRYCVQPDAVKDNTKSGDKLDNKDEEDEQQHLRRATDLLITG